MVPFCFAETTALSGAVSTLRVKRHLRQKKLCYKHGICGGYGGFQGGAQGFQGGYQGGYQQHGGYPVPPINIAISQSQASANEGGGGHANGYYPNNHQYNGYPNQGGFPNKGGYGGYGGYPNQGGYGAGHFGNGQSAYNNQFNGNYYGPVGGGGHQGGGYGFQRPFGSFYDESPEEEGSKPEQSETEEGQNGPGYNDFNQGQGFNQGGYQGQGQEHGHGHENFAVAGAFALTGRKNQ